MKKKIRRSFRNGVKITTNFAKKAKYGENTTVKIICDEGQRKTD